MLFILLVSALYIPIIICFFTEITPFQQNFNVFIDFIFICDFVVNFFTAYDEKGRLVTELGKIRLRYVKSYALLDAFTMFPWQAAGWFIKEDKLGTRTSILFYGFIVKSLRILRIPSKLEITKPFIILVKFVDIPKLERRFSFIFAYVTPLTRIFSLLLTVLYFSHFIGCFWFFVSMAQGYPSDCWVVGSGLLDSDWQT